MYRAMTEMTVSPSLIDRIAACLATFNVPNPRQVAVDNAYRFASTEGWADAWQSAVDGYNINQNPDTGARTDVISDEMIRTGVGLLYGPTERTDEEGRVTTKAADPTLAPEEGGPRFEAHVHEDAVLDEPVIRDDSHVDRSMDPTPRRVEAPRHPRG